MSARSQDSSLASQRLAERRRALRALLMRPLMTSADPDFGAVRSHADELRPWLLRETGWVLHLERDSARLIKRPGGLVRRHARCARVRTAPVCSALPRLCRAGACGGADHTQESRR